MAGNEDEYIILSGFPIVVWRSRKYPDPSGCADAESRNGCKNDDTMPGETDRMSVNWSSDVRKEKSQIQFSEIM